MKRDAIVKLAIQTVAICFGLLGLVSVWGGLSFLVMSIRDSDRSMLFITPPLFLLLGGAGIAVAWQAVRRFGPTAIRNVVGLMAFFAWSMLTWFPESSQDGGPRWRSDLVDAAIVLGSLCLAFLLYRMLSRKLIQMTGTATPSDGPQVDVNSSGHDSMCDKWEGTGSGPRLRFRQSPGLPGGQGVDRGVAS
jgi:hypothetical protein